MELSVDAVREKSIGDNHMDVHGWSAAGASASCTRPDCPAIVLDIFSIIIQTAKYRG